MNNSELCEIAKKLEDRGDIERAYQCYLEAALTEDDGEAMYTLAKMYFEGDYVRQDYDKAGLYFGMAYDHKVNIEPWMLIQAGRYWERRTQEMSKTILLLKGTIRRQLIWALDMGMSVLESYIIRLGITKNHMNISYRWKNVTR